MSRPRSEQDHELQASLERINGALKQSRDQYANLVAQIMEATSSEVAARVSESMERASARFADQRQRRVRRQERHRESEGREGRRRENWEGPERWEGRERGERKRGARPVRAAGGGQAAAAEMPKAFVFAAAALICLVLAVLRPQLWWLIFVAFGFGTSAAQIFGKARQAEASRDSQAEEPEEADVAWEEVPEAPQERNPASTAAAGPAQAAPPDPPDPRVARIQSLCDKLLAELKSGPPVVREVVTEPEATIGGLRQACLEIARRERELRSVLAAQDEAELVAEREALAARLETEHDAIVRDRLGQALRALEQQLTHRAELATAATRLEAENTRILYTLESLHMQLLRARTTDVGGPELGGKLRESLRDLGTEIDAVAEALELASGPSGVNRDWRPPAAATTTAPSSATDAERAERQAAARRAEQAGKAERR